VSAEINRLRWRCQRGMLELDHILRAFLDRHYPSARPDVRRAFESLLEMEDADLLDLIMSRATPASPTVAEALASLRRGG
jgi:antitoxin CptB